MPYIQLSDIHKAYRNGKQQLSVLRGLSLTVEKGEMVSIMGRSGSGKTTLLQILAGLLSPDQGLYVTDHAEIPFGDKKALRTLRNQHIGFIMQEDLLLYDRSVMRNIALPLQYMQKKNAPLTKSKSSRLQKNWESILCCKKIQKIYPEEKDNASRSPELWYGMWTFCWQTSQRVL